MRGNGGIRMKNRGTEMEGERGTGREKGGYRERKWEKFRYGGKKSGNVGKGKVKGVQGRGNGYRE